jgi:hypothetical protein
MLLPIPTLSKELIDALEQRFPERSPDPDWIDRKIWIEVGKREVVRFLQRTFKEQSKESLKGSLNV